MGIIGYTHGVRFISNPARNSAGKRIQLPVPSAFCTCAVRESVSRTSGRAGAGVGDPPFCSTAGVICGFGNEGAVVGSCCTAVHCDLCYSAADGVLGCYSCTLRSWYKPNKNK